MRFTSLVVVVVHAALVVAQSMPNPFNNPTGGYDLQAGQSVRLSWQPTTPGTISLVLREGNPSNLTTISTIASSIPNSGSYTWQIPSNTPEGSTYTIEIQSDSNPSEVNYSPPVIIQSTVLSSVTSPSPSATTPSSSSPSPSASKTHAHHTPKPSKHHHHHTTTPSPSPNAHSAHPVATSTNVAAPAVAKRVGGALAGLVAVGVGAAAVL